MHLALRYIGIGPGDVVFSSSLTFIGSCNPVLYQGGTLVFIDSEPGTWNMSPAALAKAVAEAEKTNNLPKAVIVTNLYGQSADYDSIKAVCEPKGVPVIEDAAESIGATYRGKSSGTAGDLGIYSFNGNKILTTSGGGMLVAHDVEVLAKVRFWATQARDRARHYEHSELGYNYRMSNILAAIGRGQLRVLEERIKRKKEIYSFYKSALSDIEEISLMPIADYGKPNYWLTVITIAAGSRIRPDDIMNSLEAENIESRPVWKPMHLQPLYKESKYFAHDGNVSVSDDIFFRGVCLPSGTALTDLELGYIVALIRKAFGK